MFRGLLAASGFLFVIPAVWANVQVGLDKGQNHALIAAGVGMVIGAAVVGVGIVRAMRTQNYLLGAGLAVLFGALTAGSFSNAIGLTSHGRSEGRTVAKTAAEKVRNLEDQKRTMEDALRSGISTLQGPSSATLQAQIDAKMLQPFYGRSKSCSDVTLPDSRAECGELFRIRGQFVTVKKLEETRDHLRTISDLLREAPPAPDALDPQAESLLAILSLFTTLEGDASKDVGLAVNALIAICIELMAGLLPGVVEFIVYAVPAPRQRREEPVKATAAAKPAKAVAEVPEGVAEFIGERLVKRGGAGLVAGDLLNAYRGFCAERGLDPVNQRTLGLAMAAAGFKKERSGNVRYIGVALRNERPSLSLVGGQV